jgi:hypothetical protein
MPLNYVDQLKVRRHSYDLGLLSPSLLKIDSDREQRASVMNDNLGSQIMYPVLGGSLYSVWNTPGSGLPIDVCLSRTAQRV